VILLIAIDGGSTSLLFKLSNPLSLPLVILGLTLEFLFRIIRIAITLKDILEELGEWEKKP